MIALFACADPTPPPAPPAARAWIEERKVDAGEPVVLHAPIAETPAPSDGLAIAQRSVGDDGTATWELRGEPGSYWVGVGEAQLFFDIGVEGPTGGPMEDLVAVPAPPPPVWPWVAGGLVAAALLGVGAVKAWQRFKPVPPPPPPEPAHVRARREWAALRVRDDLAHESLALELSAVYRRYLEAAGGWTATARTTREILDNLAGEMTALQLDRARRLLSAMDLVKFSDHEARAELFAKFDDDFDQLVPRA
ncbi:MAG: hypothetical protein ACOZNI_23710 [Myxococcota bacterium]